ncbi:MAG TPA: SRPBCC family protein [Mycobacterium sp.]|nr:SRPBCC family protein [Mycobacterium sp.]
MAAPLLQAQIDIDAPVDKVWELISDVRRMGEWSPQCISMRPLGPVRPGTRTLNVNRRKRLFYTTTSTITEMVPQKKFAFRVNTNNTIWSYELEPSAAGTRVVESRHAENGVKPLPNLIARMFFGGVPSFEDELLDGMNDSLVRIKAAAEKA